VAQYPAAERDASRLLVIDRTLQRVIHSGYFRDLTEFLAGDVIALNDTRVIPACIEGLRPGGGAVRLLFLADTYDASTRTAAALINPSRRLREGLEIDLPGRKAFILSQRYKDGGWCGEWIDKISPTVDMPNLFDWLNLYGKPPLPPYIKRRHELNDYNRYQTVYAAAPGSLAAPTAGLHFTPDLFAALQTHGCQIGRLTLDIGLGTFEPIRSDDITQHKMHTESYCIPPQTAALINAARQNRQPITAVGTTVVRALEAAALKSIPLTFGSAEADLFIYPPFEFKVIDRLLTNFHRPDSTLLQLVAAFLGWDLLNTAYQTALESGFRFYSYGDAMLII